MSISDQSAIEDEVTADRAEGRPYDPDELYAQGMAYYRRRQWREARTCFERVKALQPNYRGIESLLRELDIFLQLESVESQTKVDGGPAAPDSASSSTPASGGVTLPETVARLEEPELAAPSAPRWWIWPLVLFAAVALVVIVYVVLMDPFGLINADQKLQVRCQSNLVAQNWCVALEACSEWATALPDNLDARNGVTKSASALYEEGVNYAQVGDISSALRALRCLATHDSSYKDVSAMIVELEQEQALEQRLVEAQQRLDSQSYSQSIRLLLDIRAADADYRSGTVADLLYAAYKGLARQLLERAAAALRESSDANPSAPRYDVTQSVLNDVVEASKALEKALSEKPTLGEAQQAYKQASGLLGGLQSYSEWNWEPSVTAFTVIYGLDADYFSGKAALLLCDAYLHLGDLYLAADDYVAALAQFEAMAKLGVCDGALASAKAAEAGLPLTPTATPTSTPTSTSTSTPTVTPTNTPRPPTPTMTPVPTSTDVPTPVPDNSGSSGGSGDDDKPAPKPTPKEQMIPRTPST